MIEVDPYDDLVTCVKTGSEMNGSVVMWTYAYLIGDTLLDAGCPNAAMEIKEFAANNPVSRVYVTHTHEHHLGGCAVLAPEAEIYATPPVVEALKNPEALPDFFVMVWGQPEPVPEVLPMPQKFEIGDLSLELLSLPGHTDHMVGFYERERGWLFSADAVPLPSRKQLAMPDENVPEMITTMEEIQNLNLNLLLDGHRGPVENPHEYIQKRIDYLKDLQVSIKGLHSRGQDIPDIQESLGIEGPWYVGMTEGRFRIDHLIRSLLFDEVSTS
ncbi:MAG: MBL fold metallo-hydrolase [Candidatus Thorarchaeota archaeon]|jgi:glyoxylase-like metal-dependent hydrolase (beta-lactamase superfamily II)